MILLIGLAVGVDYSMFYLRRKMEERDAGRSQRGRARVRRRHVRQGRARLRPHRADRDGRHVPGRQRRLHLLRRRHDARRRRRDARQRHRPPRRAVQARRQRREGPRAVHRPRCAIATTASRACGAGSSTARSPAPSSSVVAAGGLLLVLAIPALHMHTINPGAAGLPHDLPIMQTYERIQAAFPGGPLPALVVVQAEDVTDARGPEGHRGAHGDRERPDERHRQPEQARRDRRHPAARQRHRRHAPTPRWCSCATTRSRATIDQVPGTKTNVTGMTAGSKDFNDKLTSRLPVVFAFVLGLAFLLLLVTFRSIVVPLKAIVLNLLSRRRRLRRPRLRSSRTATSRACSASSRSAGSRPGCRCSCS